MKKIKAFFYVLSKSATSLKYYKEVVNLNLDFSLKYFFSLALLTAVLSSIALFAPLVRDTRQQLNMLIDEGVSFYPEELVITVEGGKLNINQPEPYIIPLPQSMDTETVNNQANLNSIDIDNLIVFDSDGTLSDLEELSTVILVNESNILIKQTNPQGYSEKIEVYPLSDFPDGTLDRATVQTFADQIKPYLKYVPALIVLVGFFGLIFKNIALRLPFLLFVGLVLMVVGNLGKVKLPFGKNFQIAIHAITIPALVELVAHAFKYTIPVPFWFGITSIAIGVLALMTIKGNADTTGNTIPIPSPTQEENN